MMYPQNPHLTSGGLYLDTHYTSSLRLMHIAPDSMPDSLFFTFCGDILGASGEHYEKGKSLPFADYARLASTHFSDDFMESLAMVQMREEVIETSLDGLMLGRDRFFNLIKTHFESLAQTYSPWSKDLFAAKTTADFTDVLAQHDSCGTAMRAPTLAALDLSPEKALPLMLITHGHLQAIEGGFYIYGFAQAARQGHSFKIALKYAENQALWGRAACREWQSRENIPMYDSPPIAESVTRVLETGDPYINISDIGKEGIDTHFVVSSVMLALQDVFDTPTSTQTSLTDNSISQFIERAMTIGGDPDTICSIGLSLYGMRHPGPASAFLSGIRIGS